MAESIEVTAERAPTDAELRALIDFAPDGIFVVDSDGRLTFMNSATCRLVGYECEELIGTTVTHLMPAEDAERIHKASAQRPHGACHVTDSTLRRKDGTSVPVEVSATMLPDGRWQGWVRDISERRARDAARDGVFAQLEADRQWLQTVIDTVPLGVLLFHPDGRLSCNRRAEELLGIELSATGGSAQYANSIYFPDGRPVPADQLVSERVLRRGETVIGEELVVERPDGTRISILGSAAPIRDAAGAVIGGVGVFQDVSERMRLDQALRMNEQLLQNIFDILPVGVWIADKTGRIVRNNPAGERIWKGARYVPVAEYGQYKGWWLETGKPIEAEEWAMARALLRGETSPAELVRIQCFDGSFKTIINSAVPLRDESGGIAGAIVVNEDITALQEAQEQQRASERLLRTVFNLLPVGVWVTDRDGRITLANPAGGRIWAGTRYVGPEDYVQYKGWWLETGEPIEPGQWGLARAIRDGEAVGGELLRIQTFDGSFKTVINWASPIRSDEGEIVGAVAVNEDVTSLHHTQEQLRASVRDREEILAVVAHDLRNPLHGIMTTAATVDVEVRKVRGTEGVLGLTASLVDIARRMSGLVEDLLTVAVAGAGGPSMLRLASVPASSLLAKAASAVRPLVARAGLDLELDVTGGLPNVNVDADRILRVFANLLDNALKFTSSPGRITLAAERSAGGVRFSVANTGPALAAEKRDAMFQPFWQSGRDRRGAGLGLSICRSIVESHGGSIWAEPVEGRRVRVCFVLPRGGVSIPKS